MKKLLKLISLSICLFCLTGCVKSEFNHTNDVYTTIYPIEYITKYLYGDNTQVKSIYPNGADVYNYPLTDKQKDLYSSGKIFIYNGLTKENEIAREFLNINEDIIPIDVSYSIKYNYSVEELWLSPNNFLMVAKNIKNNLLDYTTSKIIKEEIENNFKKLEISLSSMDATLRDIAESAKKEGNPTLIVSSNKLQFLEKYGFTIINLENESNSITTLKSNFKSGAYKDIYLCKTDERTELIDDLVNNSKANLINVYTMETLTDELVLEQEDYLSIMNAFIDNIQNTTLT